MVCCSAARTPQRSQRPKSPAQQLHPVTTSTRCFSFYFSFFLFDSACFCHLLSDQDGKPNVHHDPQASAEDGWSIFPKNGSVSNCTSFCTSFPRLQALQSTAKPSHSHELSATNHKVIYIKTNNVTHSERMTSHHYHKFTVIEKASNWRIFLHAYDEMVSERTGGQIVLQIFTDASPSVATKSILSTSENVADDIFHILTWDNHAKSTSKSESLKMFKNIRMRTDCNPRDNNDRIGG